MVKSGGRSNRFAPAVLSAFLIVGAGCVGEDTANLEANKAVIVRWAELLDRGQFAALEDIAAPDCVIHYPGGLEERGLQVIIDGAIQSAAAFSEGIHRVETQVAEGDLVATRYLYTAKHTGEYLGFAPTGLTVSLTVQEICRLSDGRIVECWVEFDSEALSRQLRGESTPGGDTT